MDISNELQYLKEGHYIVLDCNTRVFVREYNYRSLSFFLWRRLRMRFKCSISFFRKSNKTSQPFEANEIIYRKGDAEAIFINYREYLVLRKYAEFQKYIRAKKGYDTLKKFYRLNEVHFLEKNITQERLIVGKILRKANKTYQNFVFQEVFDRYNACLTKESFPKYKALIDFNEFLSRMRKSNVPNELIEYVDKEKISLENTFNNLKWTWCHSDLTPDNIMYNKTGYFVIDIERSEILPISYDMLNFIKSFVIICKNKSPLKLYFKGEYDELIMNSTSITNVRNIDRKNLIAIFLILKSILAWNAEVYKNNSSEARKRWNVFKFYFGY